MPKPKAPYGSLDWREEQEEQAEDEAWERRQKQRQEKEKAASKGSVPSIKRKED